VTADELDLIDDVYIDTRYPGSFGLLQSGLPSKEQAISLLEIAEKIHEAVCKKLSS
jgi:HEPN domain-containing protein